MLNTETGLKHLARLSNRERELLHSVINDLSQIALVTCDVDTAIEVTIKDVDEVVSVHYDIPAKTYRMTFSMQLPFMTLIDVLLHELAHIRAGSRAHDSEFGACFATLFSVWECIYNEYAKVSAVGGINE